MVSHRGLYTRQCRRAEQSYAEGFRRFDLDECDRIVSEARREGRPVSEAFTPERLHAYFADTVPRRRRTALREGR